MSQRTYGYRWCYICGKDVLSGGLGWFNHCMKHVRDWKMVRNIRYDAHGHRYNEFKPIDGVTIIPQPKRKIP